MQPKLWQIPTPNQKTLFRLPEKSKTLYQRIMQIAHNHQKPKFASSLAVEDLVIHHAIAHTGANIAVFSLETGRLNTETHSLITTISQNYPTITIQLYHPNPSDIKNYVQTHGENAFYESIALRRKCCDIRKIQPLNQALNDADAWLTGQRREQSITRTQLTFAEHDDARNIAKYNPIYDWSEHDVWAYIQTHQIPFNHLYTQGYPSIGCEPCTIPVKQGEDIRAGRWWWETRDTKECGLHQT